MKRFFLCVAAIIITALSIKAISLGATFYAQETEERKVRLMLEASRLSAQ